MKTPLHTAILSIAIALSTHSAAQTITCDLFSVTGMEPDAFNVNNTMINIAMEGEFSLFANYPYIASVTDCNEDTIATGGLYYFGQLGGTEQGYPVSLIPDDVCFPIEIEFVFGNDLFENDTCYYTYQTTGFSRTTDTHFDLNVYPNPTRDKIQLSSSASMCGEEYSIYNTSGKSVKTGKINSLNATIDVSHLPNGFYTLNIRNTSSRFVKE
jgi:hypothetical protein